MEQTSALIVIDMQEGIFKLKQPVHRASDVIENIKRLIAWARENGITVFFSQHENNSFLKYGSADWKIVDALPMVESDQVINKRHPSIFKETELSARLKKDQISRLYIAGLISNGCVRDACLDALHRDFQVVLVKDAHSTFYKNAEKLIQQVNMEIENAGAFAKTTEELLKMPGL